MNIALDVSYTYTLWETPLTMTFGSDSNNHWHVLSWLNIFVIPLIINSWIYKFKYISYLLDQNEENLETETKYAYKILK